MEVVEEDTMVATKVVLRVEEVGEVAHPVVRMEEAVRERASAAVAWTEEDWMELVATVAAFWEGVATALEYLVVKMETAVEEPVVGSKEMVWVRRVTEKD